MYFLFFLVNRTIETEQFSLKLLRMGVWIMRRMMEGINLTKAHYKHIYK
jgi:hypothetical protein